MSAEASSYLRQLRGGKPKFMEPDALLWHSSFVCDLPVDHKLNAYILIGCVKRRV
jgi:hypothetical protein